jgi:hypothetical protein
MADEVSLRGLPRLGRVGRRGVQIALGLLWLIGQSLGGLTTGEATDPNIGPLLVLLAAALWPRTALPPASDRPPRVPTGSWRAGHPRRSAPGAG